MFPREDVVFIAKMDYPFGETRSVDQDWQYIMWNFDFEAPSAGLDLVSKGAFAKPPRCGGKAPNARSPIARRPLRPAPRSSVV